MMPQKDKLCQRHRWPQRMRLLFVEDDASLMKGLVFALEKQGYEVVCARSLREAEEKWQLGRYDLVLLDVSLPDGTGYALCAKIRETSKVPIIFLTAADDETDITMGLDMGGDDYITKPFKLAVFLSRVNALLRRSMDYSEKEVLRAGEIEVNLLRRTVTKNGNELALTASEYKLLVLFMENIGQVLTSEQILSRLWDYEERYIDSSALSVYIRRLRKKIEDDPSAPRYIVTVRGMGYKWAEEETQ